MSGGHFDYNEHRLNDIADEIEQLIQKNDSKEKDEWGYDIGHHYSKSTIAKFSETVKMLRLMEKMVSAIDYLVCGDTGEDEFTKCWQEITERKK